MGWGWALALARRGHRVTVLTRSNNRSAIERAVPLTEGWSIEFVYCDLPVWARRWKKARRGIHLYYLLWQWLAYRHAKLLHNRDPFDRVHHVTFASIRQPSFMGGLGVPFIFGPVAGGECIPPKLLSSFGWAERVYERSREALTHLAMWDPLVRRTLRQAESIYVTSRETARLVPTRHQSKTRTRLAVGLGAWEKQRDVIGVHRNAGFHVLYVGNLLKLKGLHLALRAFAKVFQGRPETSFTIVGSGPARNSLVQLVSKLSLGEQVRWAGQLDRDELWPIYRVHDALLFPSMRDSGGMAVLEALAHGVPVVCLKLAGPGTIVDNSCGIAVPAGDREETEVVQSLADALCKLADDETLRHRLARGATDRVQTFTWERKVAQIEAELMADTVTSP